MKNISTELQKNLFRLILLSLFIALPLLLCAQEQSDRIDQFYTGVNVYAFDRHVYLQLTGESIYEDAEAPISFSFNFLFAEDSESRSRDTASGNFGYEAIFPVNINVDGQDFSFISGYSFLFDFSRFDTAPEDILRADNQSSVSRANMTLNNYNIGARVYFGQSYSEADILSEEFVQYLRFFIGTGWGWMEGQFFGEQVKNGSIEEFQTPFYGPRTYREFGLNLANDTIGVNYIFRVITADRTATCGEVDDPVRMGEIFKAVGSTSIEGCSAANDPFDQTADDQFIIDFSGIINIFNFELKF